MGSETTKKTRRRRTFKQNTIALIYDFDGTLSPQAMQEYTVLPKIGLNPAEFWKEVKEQQEKHNADEILTYMRLMIEKLEGKQQHLEKKDLGALAQSIQYFKGVEEWFDDINEYVQSKTEGKVKIRHYIISAGNKEILEGIKIKKFFEKIFACEYFFDHHHKATFPNVVINDTAKTQFIFRINKGKEKMTESINSHMDDEERPIPFENMIYFGDGLTDVPCMTLTRKYGGHSIAVYNPAHKGRKKNNPAHKCMELYHSGRIDFFAEADYSHGSQLNLFVKRLLDLKIARIVMKQEEFECEKKVEDYIAKQARMTNKAKKEIDNVEETEIGIDVDRERGISES